MTKHDRETARWPGRRALQTGQVSRVQVVDTETGDLRTVAELPILFEAPNWTPDGEWLILNGGFQLYRIRADGSGGLVHIPTGMINGINNDHILSPDGKTIYFSASGKAYAVPLEGGDPVQVSNDHPEERGYQYWLHGISPDGKTLVYTATERVGDNMRGRLSICTVPVDGGPDAYIVSRDQVSDGPEYSRDGEWIYFNSEIAAKRPGHAQIFRVRPDGSDIEQITHDDRVNWFPHFSPDGETMAYISYDEGTRSHPADMDIELRLMPANGGESRVAVSAFGGQGTFNVNSWAPDSRHFAYVDYPFKD